MGQIRWDKLPSRITILENRWTELIWGWWAHKFKAWLADEEATTSSLLLLPRVPETAAKFSNKFTSVTGEDIMAKFSPPPPPASSSCEGETSIDRLYFLAAKHCHRSPCQFQSNKCSCFRLTFLPRILCPRNNACTTWFNR